MGAMWVVLASCSENAPQVATGNRPAQGDAARGAALVSQLGCGACHQIPGIADAQGFVGPPLTLMGRRVFIAGVLRNSPDSMRAWLENPQRFVPGNAMPDMGITETQARDITAYLFTLR